MSFHLGRTLEAVAVAVVSMLCASVSCAQQPFSQSSNPGSYVGFAQTPPAAYSNSSSAFGSINQVPVHNGGAFFVACWADVPSHNSAYFSATFAARGVGAVHSMRTQFRSFVTT